MSVFATRLPRLLRALQKEGVADPKKDQRWKDFKKRLDKDFNMDKANLEKKYRPARKKATEARTKFEALNSKFEDEDDEDDEDFTLDAFDSE